MLFDYYFWDYDGTLFDTYPSIVRAYQKGLRKLDIEIDYDKLYAWTKVSLGHAARVLERQFGVPAREIMENYTHYAHDESYDAILPYSGAKELLEAVVGHGGRNYLYTHRDTSAIQMLKYHGLFGVFDDYVTSEDDFPHKPEPDALKHLLAKHKLDVSRCIMLGDREIDVAAGMNAGMAGALFDPDSFCGPTNADYRFMSFSEIQETLVDLWQTKTRTLCRC